MIKNTVQYSIFQTNLKCTIRIRTEKKKIIM